MPAGQIYSFQFLHRFLSSKCFRKDGGFDVRLKFDSFDTEPVSMEHVKEGLRYLKCEIGCIKFDKEYCEGLFREVFRT